MPDSVASSQMALCLPNLSQTSASGLAHLVAHAEAAGTISTHCLPLTATGHLDVAANPFWDATDLKGAWAMAVRGRETQPPSSASVAVGWFDAVAVRRSCFDQGIDALAITCLGVLSGLDTIKIITAYRLSDRTTISMMPDDPVHMCAPVYQCMPGWSVDMGDCRTFNDLPKTARDFIGAVQEATGYRVRWVLTGSDPHHAIAVPPVAVTDD
jgi:adenylosuccinate synthase